MIITKIRCSNEESENIESISNKENIEQNDEQQQQQSKQSENQLSTSNQSSSIDDISNENTSSTESPVSSESSSSSATAAKATTNRYNCTPVERGPGEIAKLIVINSTMQPDYLQLKNYFIADLFFMNHSMTAAQNSMNNKNDKSSSTVMNGNNETLQSSQPSSATNETGQCTIMIFYYNWCRFSAAAAPNFNAIGRLFPQMYIMAIDAYYHYSITIRFGVSGVPSLYFLYNGRAVAKYNRSDITVDGLIEFIRSMTSLEPISNDNNTKIIDDTDDSDETNENKTKTIKNHWNVTDDDYQGPLLIQLDDQQNYSILLCWKFCLIVFLYHFFRSNLFIKIKDHVRGMWNEWAQHHEHAD